MSYVFPPAPVVALSVQGDDLQFPVRRVYCVGRNYAAHAKEMGVDPSRESPFFFCKPADAVVASKRAEQEVLMPYPPQTQDLHHEVELVVAIGQAGSNIAVAQALAHVWGYAIGLDMTRRDLQRAAKDKGHPWEVAKAFDQSAPVGLLVPANKVETSLTAARIALSVEGHLKQHNDLSQMIWSVAEIVSHLSRYFELQAGDLIFTGTPEGVGAVQRGQLLSASIDGLPTLNARIT